MAQAFLNVAQPDEAKNKDVVRIIERTVSGDYEIPEGITEIGVSAFQYCRKLTSVKIPESVVSLGASAFGETYLTELVLPMNCSVLKSYALSTMRELVTLKAGDLKNIANNAFTNNTKCILYDFSKCTQVPTLRNVNAFSHINAEAKILVPFHLYGEWIVATNWSQFADYIIPSENAPEFIRPEAVSENLYVQPLGSGENAILGRGGCRDSVIVVPNEFEGIAISKIGDYAFSDDEDIEELYTGAVLYIGSGVCGSSSLKRLYLENVTSVSDVTFLCDELEYVRFSENINYIGAESFRSNKSATVYDFSAFGGDKIPTLEANALTPSKIIVPMEKYYEWKAAPNWSNFANVIVAAANNDK